MTEFSTLMRDTLDARLFSVAGNPFTLGSLLGALVALIALLVFARWLRRLISQRLLARGHFDASIRETVSALTQYVVLGIGIVSILNIAGIQLSSFTVLAGAFGVGVGFGLQNIFSNFISGLIVMFERPIKIGDHIVLGGVDGDVAYIGMRATTLRTAQGSLVLVPNQAIITNNVTLAEDEALLLRVVTGNPDVLKSPQPAVYVPAVDHAGHLMEVHFSVQGDATTRLGVVSAINAALVAELAAAGKALAPNP